MDDVDVDSMVSSYIQKLLLTRMNGKIYLKTKNQIVCFLNINIFNFLEWTIVQQRAAIVSSWKKLSGRRLLGSSGKFIN